MKTAHHCFDQWRYHCGKTGGMRKDNVILRLLNLLFFLIFPCKCLTSTKVIHMYFPEIYKREFSEAFPSAAAATAAKSLQSCPTLCNPIDSSPPGSPIPGILQARTLEWVRPFLEVYKTVKEIPNTKRLTLS